MAYPTVSVQPGDSGAAVKQLQDWLVSQGYLTQAQVNTGYGTYGPQTTAAVLSWQKANGVDYSSGPGYWGPKSVAAAQGGGGSGGGNNTPTPPSSSAGGGSVSGTNGLPPGASMTDNYGRTIDGYYQLNGAWYKMGTMPPGTSAPAPTQTSTAAPTGVQPPTAALQPGATGAGVKQLQDYLVSVGLMTQAQVDTGYGTYGPQTTAAVQKLQEQLGVDNSTGVGFWGPRTVQAVQSSPTFGKTTTTPAGADPNSPLAGLLNNPNLSADQKAAIQSIYDAVSTNDASSADRIKAAMTAATQYSDPYFKAQTRLALDALDRGMNAKDGDLAYSENQLSSALSALRDSTAASKDMLSFDHSQELHNLATKYETDLGDTRDSLAAAGFTSSSKRARAENILGDNNTGLVESSNKKFSYDTGNLDRTLSTNDASTQAQIENLKRLAAEDKLGLYRTAEGQVGSDHLPAIDGLTPLGDVGGSIPRAQAVDALSFASNFVN